MKQLGTQLLRSHIRVHSEIQENKWKDYEEITEIMLCLFKSSFKLAYMFSWEEISVAKMPIIEDTPLFSLLILKRHVCIINCQQHGIYCLRH